MKLELFATMVLCTQHVFVGDLTIGESRKSFRGKIEDLYKDVDTWATIKKKNVLFAKTNGDELVIFIKDKKGE